jgi:NAD(P)-dependent dehydrogenase (short-subunit alcohol dehydrogenase family)
MKKPYPEQLRFLQNRNAVQAVSETRMEGKTVVLTGGTSGVGLSAAHRLARFGATLVIVARNKEKAETVKQTLEKSYGTNVSFVIADFAKLDDVRHAAKTILEQTPKIDVLINCAGLHSTKRHLTVDGFEEVFAVNHLASFLFTRLLFPRLKESAPARILQINSEGHRFSSFHENDPNWKRHLYTGLKSYGASKTAQLLTVWKMADEWKNLGVVINAMHPGDVLTSIGQNNGPLYRWFFRHFTSKMLKDPAISGEAIHYLVADSALEGVSGKFFHLTIEELPAKHARSLEKAELVFQKSLEWTKTK